MVYTSDATVGRTTEFVDVEEAESRLLSLTDEDVLTLARYAVTIEEHYGRPMDIEWGKDGVDGQLYVLQARRRPSSPAPAAPWSATSSPAPARWSSRAGRSGRRSAPARSRF